MPTRSIRPSRSKIWSPTCAAARWTCWSSWAAIPPTMRPPTSDFADALKNTKYSAAGSSRPLSGRNRRTLPVARERSALPRSLGRCPRLRRHGQHRAAADCAALRRQERARIGGAAGRTGRRRRSRNRAGLLEEAALRRGLRHFWRKSLHDGWIEGTAFAPKQVAKQGRELPGRAEPWTPRPSKSTSAAILPSTTDASPTTAGCRNCPSR